MNGKQNTKNIFSPKLFLEALRELRKAGILFLIIFFLEAILIPLGNFIYNADDYINYVPESVGMLNVNPIIVVLPCVVAPLLTLIAFSFLNKRNSSDFMHSLPFRRECVFISYFAAIAAWLFIIGLGSSIVSVLSCAIFPKLFNVLVSDFLINFISFFVISIYISAAIAFAMSVSGTLLNNIVVSGLVIFAPRFFITIISVIVENVPFIVSTTNMFSVLTKNYNIVWGFFSEIISDKVNVMPFNKMITSPTCILYMLGLSIILFGLGLLFFKKRKSEAANASAPNRIIQAIYRNTLSMVVCSIVCYYIVEGIIKNYTPDASDIFVYAVWYLIAIIVYFVYELITTKKAKNLLKIAPGLLIVAVLNIALIAGMYLVYRAETYIIPSYDEVDYVCVGEKYTGDYRFFEEKTYVTDKLSTVQIKDEEVIKTLCDGLNETVKQYEVLNNSFRRYMNENNCINVSFHVGNSVIERIVVLSAKDYNNVENALFENESYAKAFDSVYEDIINNIDGYEAYLSVSSYSSSGETAKAVALKYCEEMLAMNMKNRMYIIENRYYDAYQGRLELSRNDGIKTTRILSFSIGRETPLTYAVIQELIDEGSKEQKKSMLYTLSEEKDLSNIFYVDIQILLDPSIGDYISMGISERFESFVAFSNNSLFEIYDGGYTNDGDGVKIIIRIEASDYYYEVPFFIPKEYFPQFTGMLEVYDPGVAKAVREYEDLEKAEISYELN